MTRARIAAVLVVMAVLAVALIARLGGDEEPLAEPTPAASTPSVPSGSPSSDASPSGEPTAVPQAPDAPYRFAFKRMDAAGQFLARVTNRSENYAFIQCLVAARDASGALVLDRTYEAYDPDGNLYVQDLYTSFVELPAGGYIRVDVHLAPTAPVAEYSAECEERPDPDGIPGPEG